MRKRILCTGARLGWVSLFVLTSSACSIFAPEKKSLTETEACTQLQKVIAGHSNNFKQVRLAPNNSRRLGGVRTWRADRIFPLAKNCQVWEWSAGLSNYICLWKESDKVEAKASYDQGVASVRGCLGKQWQQDVTSTKSGGGKTLFHQLGGKTIVSIRYFKEGRTVWDHWQTTLYVGDESNLDAAVQ